MPHYAECNICGRRARASAMPAAELENFRLGENPCKACPNFGRRWACPPLDGRAGAQKKFANIFALEIPPSPASLSPEKITENARRETDAFFYALENSLGGAELLLAGSCICALAQNCPRLSGKPCAFPQKMRLSLEALGYDAQKICREILGTEILWAHGARHPAHYTLVYCLLADTDCSKNMPAPQTAAPAK